VRRLDGRGNVSSEMEVYDANQVFAGPLVPYGSLRVTLWTAPGTSKAKVTCFAWCSLADATDLLPPGPRPRADDELLERLVSD